MFQSVIELTGKISGLLRSCIERVLGRVGLESAVEIVVPDDLGSVAVFAVAVGRDIDRPQVGNTGFLNLRSLVARPAVTACFVIRRVVTRPPVDTGSAAAPWILGHTVLPSAGHGEQQPVGLNACRGRVCAQGAEAAH